MQRDIINIEDEKQKWLKQANEWVERVVNEGWEESLKITRFQAKLQEKIDREERAGGLTKKTKRFLEKLQKQSEAEIEAGMQQLIDEAGSSGDIPLQEKMIARLKMLKEKW